MGVPFIIGIPWSMTVQSYLSRWTAFKASWPFVASRNMEFQVLQFPRNNLCVDYIVSVSYFTPIATDAPGLVERRLLSQLGRNLLGSLPAGIHCRKVWNNLVEIIMDLHHSTIVVVCISPKTVGSQGHMMCIGL